MKTSPDGTATAARTAGPARVAILVALGALALKLPQAFLALFLGSAAPDWMPTNGDTPTGVLMGLGWMGFGAVLLWLRRWTGLVATLWFCITSAVSGVQLGVDGYLLWGGWQALTAVAATVAAAVAAVRGAFAGSRW